MAISSQTGHSFDQPQDLKTFLRSLTAEQFRQSADYRLAQIQMRDGSIVNLFLGGLTLLFGATNQWCRLK
jgi:hypothetical protein